MITGADFRFFARRQAEDLGIEATVVIEPMRRDSGPAVAAAAALARSRDPDAVVLALAADHVILDVEEFRATCLAGLKAAEAGRIVTFGITPSAPKTSYGYIRRGKPTGSDEVYAVEAFVEKPDAETAARYVAEGYLWNSGNFLFRADVLLAELARYEPAMAEAVEEAVAGASNDLGFRAARAGGVRQRAAEVDRLRGDGEDRPRRRRRRQLPLVRHRLLGCDLRHRRARQVRQRGPRHRGDDGRAQLRDPFGRPADRRRSAPTISWWYRRPMPFWWCRARARRRCASWSPSSRARSGRRRPSTGAGIGPGAITIRSTRGERFQVKRIVVRPGGTLSLQKHHHRAEHWVVVRGTAEVTIGTDVKAVHENESIYIPIGAVHRLANRGKIPLELIEVQTGSYLGEDDIVRIEDVYKRG